LASSNSVYGLFQGYSVKNTKLDDTDERCKGRWAFFRDTLPENQKWMIQMRGVRADGPFSGIHGQKTELDDTDEMCMGRWAFFRDTRSENRTR
jgi:hypothetical protein